MAVYEPHAWVALEIDDPDGESLVKILGGWYGGFAEPDSWRLNSGVAEIRRDGEIFEFVGYSGSVYRCHPSNERMTTLMAGVLDRMRELGVSRGATVVVKPAADL